MAKALADNHTVRAITSSARYRAVVAELVVATGRPRGAVEKEARTALAEMVAHVGDPVATRTWDRMGRFLTRAYTVDSDTSRLPELARLDRDHTLVFLPNHRSYLDPLVLRQVLATQGFGPNHVLGGINLAMWPLSQLGRRSGLVFIRRTTKNDPVYPAMMRLYLGHLVSGGHNLEWYFEGGRTRTGKLRPPKMGVLRYLVDAFTEHQADVPDVYLVPISIVYDQQHEVQALSEEEGGGRKRPESLGLMVNFARAQGRRRGRAYLRFGEPLSLRDALAEAAERAGSDAPRELVPRVAFEVAHRINAATPITPSALVAFALLDNEGRALTMPETLRVLEPLLAYVRGRDLPLTSSVDLARPDGLRRALRMLVREGVVDEYDGGLEPVYGIADDRAHEAGFYRNTVTHYFLNRAILEVAVVMASQGPGPHGVAAVWQHALALRDLLKYEFFFPTKAEFDGQIRTEAETALPGWDEADLAPEDLTAATGEEPLLLAHRVIGPFLEAYAVVADQLAVREADEAPVDVDEVIASSLGVARQRWLQRELHSPESISKDLMGGAIQLADNRGLLEPGGDEVRTARQAFADELADVVRAVGVVRRTALTHFSPTAAGGER